MTTPTVSASPRGGTYTSAQSVSLTTNESGAKIYYTTNGTDPNTSSTQYTGPINISQTTILKFIARDAAGNQSAIQREDYVINSTSVDYSDTAYSATASSSSRNVVVTWRPKNVLDNGTITEVGSLRPVYFFTQYYKIDIYKNNYRVFSQMVSGVYPWTGTVKPNISYSKSDTIKFNIYAYTFNSYFNITSQNTAWFESSTGNDPFFTVKYKGNSTVDTTAPIVTASPRTGTYNQAQNIALSSNEANTKIYYTLDNSTPTASSPLYSMPIPISSTKTIKFFGKDLAGNSSQIYSETYTIDTTAPTVSASPASGTYTSAQTVTLSTNESGAKIYYTTNGTEPTTSSTQYSSPITISQTTTLKFMARDAAGNQSTARAETYTISNLTQIREPSFETINQWQKQNIGFSIGQDTSWKTDGSYSIKFSKAAATVSSDHASIFQQVDLTNIKSITFDTNGAYGSWEKFAILIDGQQVYNLDTTKYRGEQLNQYLNLSAYPGVHKLEFKLSIISPGGTGVWFAIDNIRASTDTTPPVISASPRSGTYNQVQNITLSSNESGTKIYYTLDGSVPTTSSSLYSTPISISTTKTLRFFGKDLAGNASGFYSEIYTIDTTVPTVSASPVGGTYTSAQTVTLSTNELGAKIYYTTNNSEPSTSSPLYSSPITINQTTTLKFFAQDTAGNQSATRAETYTINSSPYPTNFQDNFESYTLNSYPQNGWYMRHSGDANAVISSEKAENSQKSFKLTTNSYGYGRADAVKITPSNQMTYEVSVLVTDTRKGAWVGYFKDAVWNDTFNSIVNFGNDAKIYAGHNNQYLMSYSANQWYKVKVESDFVSQKMRVYINGSLLASDLPTGPSGFDAFMLLNYNYSQSVGGSSVIYYDNVKISSGITFDTTAPIITANPRTGTYDQAQNITLSSNEANTKIYYTLDNSTPTTSSPIYSSPINISQTKTLKFFGKDAAGNASQIQSETYTIDMTAPTVSASPASGTYTTAQNVTLTANESGVKIYYTTDGSNPTTSSAQYSTPITINQTTTLRFMARDAAGNQSAIKSETYTISTTPTAYSDSAYTTQASTSVLSASVIWHPQNTLGRGTITEIGQLLSSSGSTSASYYIDIYKNNVKIYGGTVTGKYPWTSTLKPNIPYTKTDTIKFVINGTTPFYRFYITGQNTNWFESNTGNDPYLTVKYQSS